MDTLKEFIRRRSKLGESRDEGIVKDNRPSEPQFPSPAYLNPLHNRERMLPRQEQVPESFPMPSGHFKRHSLGNIIGELSLEASKVKKAYQHHRLSSDHFFMSARSPQRWLSKRTRLHNERDSEEHVTEDEGGRSSNVEQATQNAVGEGRQASNVEQAIQNDMDGFGQSSNIEQATQNTNRQSGESSSEGEDLQFSTVRKSSRTNRYRTKEYDLEGFDVSPLSLNKTPTPPINPFPALNLRSKPSRSDIDRALTLAKSRASSPDVFTETGRTTTFTQTLLRRPGTPPILPPPSPSRSLVSVSPRPRIPAEWRQPVNPIQDAIDYCHALAAQFGLAAIYVIEIKPTRADAAPREEEIRQPGFLQKEIILSTKDCVTPGTSISLFALRGTRWLESYTGPEDDAASVAWLGIASNGELVEPVYERIWKSKTGVCKEPTAGLLFGAIVERRGKMGFKTVDMAGLWDGAMVVRDMLMNRGVGSEYTKRK